MLSDENGQVNTKVISHSFVEGEDYYIVMEGCWYSYAEDNVFKITINNVVNPPSGDET